MTYDNIIFNIYPNFGKKAQIDRAIDIPGNDVPEFLETYDFIIKNNISCVATINFYRLKNSYRITSYVVCLRKLKKKFHPLSHNFSEGTSTTHVGEYSLKRDKSNVWEIFSAEPLDAVLDFPTVKMVLQALKQLDQDISKIEKVVSIINPIIKDDTDQ